MKRRTFLSLLGGVTAAWPLAGRAQQPERMAVASSDCGTGGRAAWRTGGPDGFCTFCTERFAGCSTEKPDAAPGSGTVRVLLAPKLAFPRRAAVWRRLW
jgi:hypothetical protein